jgi:hypothetical protein
MMLSTIDLLLYLFIPSFSCRFQLPCSKLTLAFNYISDNDHDIGGHDGVENIEFKSDFKSFKKARF